jgi:hypothetical protein
MLQFVPLDWITCHIAEVSVFVLCTEDDLPEGEENCGAVANVS